jgi:hypothetical protein|eukprot:1272136-Prymnesium_polylepis.1
MNEWEARRRIKFDERVATVFMKVKGGSNNSASPGYTEMSGMEAPREAPSTLPAQAAGVATRPPENGGMQGCVHVEAGEDVHT